MANSKAKALSYLSGDLSVTDGVVTIDESVNYNTLPIDLLSSGASIRKSDGTTAVLSESGGAVTLENTSLGDTILMPDNSNNVSTAPGIRFEADTDTGIGLASAGNLAVVTGGSERARIDSSGRLLVGTSTSVRSGLLEVAKATADTQIQITESSDSGDGPTLRITRTRGSSLSSPTPAQGENFLGRIKFDSYDTAVYRTGVEIIAQADGQTWASGDCPARLVFSTTADNGSSPTERMRINSSGYVLVGYTSSNGSYKLQVNSQIFATSATIATSDGRYKENLTPLDGALNLVTQLNPVQFDWKEHPVHEFDRSQPTVGFIAQEVQEVLKDTPYVNSIIKANECLVGEERDEEGNIITEGTPEEFLGIAEGNLIALLTKALQEANAKIDALTARIEALEA